MSNIIRFPQPRPASQPQAREDETGEHCAEILFFTGVRYSCSDALKARENSRLRGKEKIEA